MSSKPSTLGSLDVWREHLLDHPGHLVRRAHQICVSAFLEENQELGLTPAQYGALACISCQPGIDQVTLAGLVALDKSTAGIVIAKLKERDLVHREADPDDRRLMRLRLTPAGQEMFERAVVTVGRAHERILAPLTSNERTMLVAMLHKLVDQNNSLSRAPYQPPSRLANSKAGSRARRKPRQPSDTSA